MLPKNGPTLSDCYLSGCILGSSLVILFKSNSMFIVVGLPNTSNSSLSPFLIESLNIALSPMCLDSG